MPDGVTGQAAVRCHAADEHPAVKRGRRPPVPQVGDDRLGDVAGKGKLVTPAAFPADHHVPER